MCPCLLVRINKPLQAVVNNQISDDEATTAVAVHQRTLHRAARLDDSIGHAAVVIHMAAMLVLEGFADPASSEGTRRDAGGVTAASSRWGWHGGGGRGVGIRVRVVGVSRAA